MSTTIEQDIAALTAALRTACDTAQAPVIDAASVAQAQVAQLVDGAQARYKGRFVDTDRTRKMARSMFTKELRRIGLIEHGARVKAGSGVDQLLTAMVDTALRFSFPAF